MPKNLSGFISRISAEFPDQVVSVRRPIRVAEYEITAVLQHLDDASFIRLFRKGRRSGGVSIHSPHLERILAKYEKRGQPAPYAEIIGHHPAFYLGALAPTMYDSDDYYTIGSFLGEPLRLVPSETWGEDFLIPADAEIIIEGEIPAGERTGV